MCGCKSWDGVFHHVCEQTDNFPRFTRSCHKKSILQNIVRENLVRGGQFVLIVMYDGCIREGRKAVDSHVYTRTNNNDGTEIVTL